VDVWSLGVVLYICLCGFPPFSDELYSRDNPYTLADQIKLGIFNYPSPYWDHIGDPALDLIDRMLTVDPEKRITVEESLEHPWMSGKYPSVADSTDGLTGAFGQLDFSRRKAARERTLLSSINDIAVSQVIDEEDEHGHSSQVKIFNKSDAGKRRHNIPARGGRARHEPAPASNRQAGEFMQFGGRGDPVLYDEPPTRGRRK
jgi:serine/threonine-protein kinase Chk2